MKIPWMVATDIKHRYNPLDICLRIIQFVLKVKQYKLFFRRIEPIPRHVFGVHFVFPQ